MADERHPTIDRFLIAAIADRLVYDSDTVFQAEDARALLQAVPRHRSPWFELGISGKRRGGSQRGFAAGVGSVNLKDDRDRQFQYSTSADAYTRAGQWKLIWHGRRTAQFIEIEQVMADVTDEGRGARICYSAAGEPLSMDIRVNRSFRLFWSPVILVIPGWRPWKTPA
ncbi:MAG: hypothetical protein AB7F35_13785 [Acetobacteraceae bacterium]